MVYLKHVKARSSNLTSCQFLVPSDQIIKQIHKNFENFKTPNCIFMSQLL